jgi:NTE family protein
MNYGTALLDMMVQAQDRLYFTDDTAARTILIPTQGVSRASFDFSRGLMDTLYQSGRQAADEFLRNWDFQRYIAQYRTGSSVGLNGDEGTP